MYDKMNEFYTSPLSFTPVNFAQIQFPGGLRTELPAAERMPLGFTVDENGRVHFRIYWPNAKKVVLHNPFFETELAKEDDFWTGAADFGTGFVPVWLTVDGSFAITPYLPLCFSDNRPTNFVDIPDGSDLRTIKDVPHGVVAEDFIPNSVTGLWERIKVYLPAAYFAQPERRFPVLYLQHGLGENEMVWTAQGKMNFMLDNLIAEGKAVPMLVVMCSGMMTTADEESSKLHYDQFHEHLISDVIPHVEKRCRAASGRENRVMAGLSMGSIQTSRTVLLHPELFCAAGLFSGFLSNPLNGDNSHLAPERLAAFRESGIFLFRAIGDSDPFMPVFVGDDNILNAAGVRCDRRIYHGNHEWNVWRQCFADFAPLLFRR